MTISVAVTGTSKAEAISRLTTALAESLDPTNAAEVAEDILHFTDDPEAGKEIVVGVTVATTIAEDGKIVSAGTAASLAIVPTE